MSTFLNRESIAFFVCQIWDGSNSTWPVFSGPAWSIDRNWNAGTCWNPKMDQHDLTWSHAQNDRFQYDTHPNPFVVVSSCFISLFKLSHLLHICVEFSNDLPQLSPPERLRYIAVRRPSLQLLGAERTHIVAQRSPDPGEDVQQPLPGIQNPWTWDENQ